MMEQQNTDLILPVISKEQYPSLYIAGGLDPYYQQIRSQALSEVPDISTKKGIARVKSLAAMVASSKVAVEKPGREYLKQLKEMPKVIEAELRDWVSKMDALRDEVRQPVTEMEEREKARIAALDQRIAAIQELGSKATSESQSTEIKLWIGELESIAIDDTWSEYKERAQVAKDSAAVKLDAFLQTRITWEAQQAEIARLKAEQEEKDRIQREEQIAAQARHEAEQKALRDKIASEQREQAAKDAAVKAQREAEEAKQRLIREQQESAERERLAAERAAEQEQQRIIQEQANRKAEEDRKAANVEHQRAINREVVSSLIAVSGITEEQAKSILCATVRKEIPHLLIQY